MGRARINIERGKEIAELFNALGPRKVSLFEDVDPQFDVAVILVSRCGRPALWLLYLNALVSYRLTTTGEGFWRSFGSFAEKRCSSALSYRECVDVVRQYTAANNRRGLGQKLKRLYTLGLCHDIEEVVWAGDLRALVAATARCLSSSPRSKTIAFAAKMVGYGLRAMGVDPEIPMDISIPVDRRVAEVTYLSGLIDVVDLADFRKRYTSYSSHIIAAWDFVGRASGVPPLRLDSVLWYFGKFIGLRSPEEVLEALDPRLKDSLGSAELEALVRALLFYRWGPSA